MLSRSHSINAGSAWTSLKTFKVDIADKETAAASHRQRNPPESPVTFAAPHPIAPLLSSPSNSWDLIVIGGGAAGYFSAITAAEASPGLRVLILERSAKVLGKVRISGGGRCNVTHACFEPKPLSGFYPRGHKSLVGPFHRWGASETVAWFESRGVTLKTEEDGRMFPITDDSQTVIDCLTGAARKAKVELAVSEGVDEISVLPDGGFLLVTTRRELTAKAVLIATGGTRSGSGGALAESLGHTLDPAVPSLFTFHIEDPRLTDLQGLAVTPATAGIEGSNATSTGPILITHWGLSGPGILKLSAWSARELANRDYRFTLKIDWLPGEEPSAAFAALRRDYGKRSIHTRSPFATVAKRFWERLVTLSGIPEGTTWSQLTSEASAALVSNLKTARFQVTGKSLNKDEFVTCGGVPLHELDLRTLQSKRCPGLYFAGEVIDVDGITGGFNFQNAWTTGHLAGTAIAAQGSSE